MWFVDLLKIVYECCIVYCFGGYVCLVVFDNGECECDELKEWGFGSSCEFMRCGCGVRGEVG